MDPTETPAESDPAPGRDRTVPATMRAVVQHRYGDPSMLALASTPVPRIGADDVLLRVDAAGIDRGTWHVLTGLPLIGRLASGIRRPKRLVAGLDVSGTVVALGADVDGFRIGDTVCGIARGSFAEYAAAPAKKLALRPPTVDPLVAGTLAVSGLTALQAVRNHARVSPGDHVLVLGASGGVGTFAVQIAVHRGAEVDAVCSATKAEAVRALGAHTVLDYRTTDALDGSTRYHAIIDIGGRPALRHLKRALTPAGRAVLVGGEGGNRLTGGFPGRIAAGALYSLVGRPRFIGFVSPERGEDIVELVRLVETGAITAAVDRVVTLDEVGTAIADLAAGRVTGKVAVRP